MLSGSSVLLSAKHKADLQLYAVPRASRQANETDSIKFLPPEATLLTKSVISLIPFFVINEVLRFKKLLLCVLILFPCRLRGLGGLETGASARQSVILGEGYRRAIRDRQATVTVHLKDACRQVGCFPAILVLQYSSLVSGVSDKELASGGYCDNPRWIASRR